MNPEPWPPIRMVNPHSEIDRLMAAFDFTWEDLDCNRAGELSDSQRRRLAGQAQSALLMSLLWAAVTAAAAAVCISLLRTNNPAFSLAGLLSMLPLVLLVTSLGNWRRINRDRRDGVVEVMQSTAGLISGDMRRGGGLLAVHAGNLEFMLTPRQFRVLNDYAAYVFYYLPHTRSLLALEPLGR